MSNNLPQNINSPDFLKLTIQDINHSIKYKYKYKYETRVHPNICIQDLINLHECVIQKINCHYLYEQYVKCISIYTKQQS